MTKTDRALFDAVQVPENFGGETIYGLILRRDKNMSKLLAALLRMLGVQQ